MRDSAQADHREADLLPGSHQLKVSVATVNRLFSAGRFILSSRRARSKGSGVLQCAIYNAATADPLIPLRLHLALAVRAAKLLISNCLVIQPAQLFARAQHFLDRIRDRSPHPPCCPGKDNAETTQPRDKPRDRTPGTNTYSADQAACRVPSSTPENPPASSGNNELL